MAGDLSRAVAITEQIHFAQDALASGLARRKITRLIRDRWGVGERTARRRVEKAVELMTAEAQGIDRTALAAQLLEIYQQLIYKASECKQFNASLGAANGLAKLAGLIDTNNKQ